MISTTKKESLGFSGTGYKYDCYALTEITMENYLKALDGALNGYQKKQTLSKEFRAKVDAKEEEFFQRDRVINSVAPVAASEAQAVGEGESAQ